MADSTPPFGGVKRFCLNGKRYENFVRTTFTQNKKIIGVVPYHFFDILNFLEPVSKFTGILGVPLSLTFLLLIVDRGCDISKYMFSGVLSTNLIIIFS